MMIMMMIDMWYIRLAVEGMQQENYNIVFPTPFSKVNEMRWNEMRCIVCIHTDTLLSLLYTHAIKMIISPSFNHYHHHHHHHSHIIIIISSFSHHHHYHYHQHHHYHHHHQHRRHHHHPHHRNHHILHHHYYHRTHHHYHLQHFHHHTHHHTYHYQFQVLAILTVWGVADLKKLEEVRTIHTDNY